MRVVSVGLRGFRYLAFFFFCLCLDGQRGVRYLFTHRQRKLRRWGVGIPLPGFVPRRASTALPSSSRERINLASKRWLCRCPWVVGSLALYCSLLALSGSWLVILMAFKDDFLSGGWLHCYGCGMGWGGGMPLLFFDFVSSKVCVVHDAWLSQKLGTRQRQ